ncbi:MAG TPA: KEOPS complex subunit Cgi121 [Thermoplasmata archaeon]|nr:KEOPS complex subunit Cgi121 [Thermoplasmata archaeon]
MTPPPVPAPHERTLQAAGARRKSAGVPSTAQFVERLRGLNRDAEGFIAVFDARAIAGERHLLSAWAHLGRSRNRGEARLRDRSAEFALYVAGDDQLPRALRKVGVAEDSEEFVVVAERPRTVDDALAAFDLAAAPEIYPRAVTAATLDRLGITAEDRTVVPEAGWEGLVLERVAFVDLSAAPKGGAAPAKTS